jgi:hypothetical protein
MFESHRWFARIVYGKRQYMVIVKACFDESGKLADQEWVVFAGCVATDNAWGAISDQWQSVLEENNIEYLTMKEAINFNGEFRDWKTRIAERNRLLIKLATIAHPLLGFYTWAPINVRKWNELTAKEQATFRNPQYAGFEGCVRNTLDSIKNPQMRIQIYCDEAEEYSDQILKLYHKLRSIDADFRSRCIGITFANDKYFRPLQMADMLAYTVRHTQVGARPEEVIVELKKIFDQGGVKSSTLVYPEGKGLGLGYVTPKEES